VAITPEPYDETQRLSDWQEGKFLLRYETPGGWWAITKSVIAEALGSGHDAAIAGLPPLAAEALKLRCPGLAILS
jgi:hypothetical protein